ncbi:hypothetical protein Tco_0857906 [Tanacetum coccineum]|uniref:Xylulose kinase-1 n=1 Tax=Tanacetum coccineum TaxID=301880 RepID=A0ABQ5B9D7_9ASTR
MALPEDHLAKFHKMTDAKEMWDAIKSRFESREIRQQGRRHRNSGNKDGADLDLRRDSKALGNRWRRCQIGSIHSGDEDYALMA